MDKPVSGAASMLSISHSVISGGSFTQNNDNRQFNIQGGTKVGFEYLKEAVAPRAFHNSGERFDPPRCHPKTRVAVMKKIMDWILGQDPDTSNALIMWLRGAAGAGKSAIAQTLAELCYEEHRLLASFFFGRSDPTRNNGRSLIATIAYQIWSTIPSVRDRIARAIEGDPLIFNRSLFTQLSVLVIKPLQDLSQSGQFSDPSAPRLILIDGLDECLDHQVQRNILDTIVKAIHQLHAPLIFLIASRSEPDISATFHSKEMMGILTEISLDDLYLPDEDIELFLRDTFKEIEETHPFKKYIPTPWPTNEVIRRLVRKSSGQFIYAATVAKYVQSNRYRPHHRLEVVLSLRPAQRDVPFVELDALYGRIFSSVEEIDRVLDVLSFYINYNNQSGDDSVYDRDNFQEINLSAMEKILSFDPGDIQLLFCDLSPVVALTESYGEEKLRMLHASLSDFLLDPSRSNQFHVDIALKRTKHASKCIQFLTYTPFTEQHAEHLAMLFLSTCLQTCVPAAELRDDILGFSISRIYKEGSKAFIETFNNFFLNAFLRSLSRSKFEDADHLYNHHLHSFDEALRHHLEIYYADMRLTLLVALLDFIRDKDRWGYLVVFQPDFQLFDLDPVLLDTEARCCSLLANEFPEYFDRIFDFFKDPARLGPYALDGEKYATSALCCLMYLCDHHSPPQTLGQQCTKRDIKIRRHTPWLWLRRRGKHGVLVKSRSWFKKTKASVYRSMKSIGIFLSDDKNMKNPAVVEGISSDKFSYGLHYLIYFLPRSTRSEELIKFASRHTFASRSQEFLDLSKKARSAIATYLERMECEKS